MIGDRIDHTASWKKGSDVSPLAEKPIRLRFVMKDADLYSMQFTSGNRDDSSTQVGLVVAVDSDFSDWSAAFDVEAFSTGDFHSP